jgi:hypothetical protein
MRSQLGTVDTLEVRSGRIDRYSRATAGVATRYRSVRFIAASGFTSWSRVAARFPRAARNLPQATPRPGGNDIDPIIVLQPTASRVAVRHALS